MKNLKTKSKLLILTFILVVTLLIGFSGCSDQGPFSTENSTDYEALKKNYKVIEIDGCEYIVYSYSRGNAGYSFMAPKCNCKCFEQQKNESTLKK